MAHVPAFVNKDITVVYATLITDTACNARCVVDALVSNFVCDVAHIVVDQFGDKVDIPDSATHFCRIMNMRIYLYKYTHFTVAVAIVHTFYTFKLCNSIQSRARLLCP